MLFLLAASTQAISDGMAMGLAIIGVVTGGGGTVATMFAYGRVKAVESTLSLLREENDTLNGIVTSVEARAEAERQACAERISTLEGQVKVLTQQQTAATVTAVMAAIRESSQYPPAPYATPHNNRPEGGTS